MRVTPASKEAWSVARAVAGSGRPALESGSPPNPTTETAGRPGARGAEEHTGRKNYANKFLTQGRKAASPEEGPTLRQCVFAFLCPTPAPVTSSISPTPWRRGCRPGGGGLTLRESRPDFRQCGDLATRPPSARSGARIRPHRNDRFCGLPRACAPPRRHARGKSV